MSPLRIKVIFENSWFFRTLVPIVTLPVTSMEENTVVRIFLRWQRWWWLHGTWPWFMFLSSLMKWWKSHRDYFYSGNGMSRTMRQTTFCPWQVDWWVLVDWQVLKDKKDWCFFLKMQKNISNQSQARTSPCSMQTWDFTGDYELKVTQCEIFLVRQQKIPKYCPLPSQIYQITDGWGTWLPTDTFLFSLCPGIFVVLIFNFCLFF